MREKGSFECGDARATPGDSERCKVRKLYLVVLAWGQALWWCALGCALGGHLFVVQTLTIDNARTGLASKSCVTGRVVDVEGGVREVRKCYET